MSVLWTGRDRENEPEPDDLDDALDFMLYLGIAAVVMTLLALF